MLTIGIFARCSIARRRKHIGVVIALVAASWGSPEAIAADERLDFEITPLIGYRYGGTFDVQGGNDAYEFDDSSSFGLVLNMREQANTQWEVLYSQQSGSAMLNSVAVSQPAVDVDIHILQIGGTYQGTGDKIRGYVAATVGGTRFDASSANDTFFSGSIGVGVQIMPEAKFGIRLEARAYATLTDSDTDLFCSTGPDLNVCAIRVEGELFNQFETFAGFVFRF
ncbi:MAG: hypothetical protein ACR2Q3_01710 [Woeseiaceae bacterium]